MWRNHGIAGLVMMVALAAAGAAPETQPAYPADLVETVEYYRVGLDFEAEPGYVHAAGAVGSGGSETEWHRFATFMLKNGHRADFESLLHEKSLSLRAMGLYCLAKSDGEKSLPVLQKYFVDEQRIGVCAYGCVAETMTLGDFAEDLVWDRNHLEYRGGAREPTLPLLAKSELVRKGLQALTGGPSAKKRGLYARRMWEMVTADPSLLDMGQFRKATPDMSDGDIIKAIASLEEAAPIRAFLIKCVEDKSLDDSAMVEVARGLLRSAGYPDARRALEHVKESVRIKAEAKE